MNPSFRYYKVSYFFYDAFSLYFACQDNNIMTFSSFFFVFPGSKLFHTWISLFYICMLYIAPFPSAKPSENFSSLFLSRLVSPVKFIYVIDRFARILCAQIFKMWSIYFAFIVYIFCFYESVHSYFIDYLYAFTAIPLCNTFRSFYFILVTFR